MNHVGPAAQENPSPATMKGVVSKLQKETTVENMPVIPIVMRKRRRVSVTVTLIVVVLISVVQERLLVKIVLLMNVLLTEHIMTPERLFMNVRKRMMSQW